MLRPEYLAGAADSVVEVYSQVEQDIAEDIARRIVKNGGMTQTARWQAYKGREFGFFQEDVDMIMSKASPKAKKEIQEIMAEAAEMSLSYDDSIYISAGLSPTAIRKSPAMMAMLLQGTDSTLALLGNFTKTTAIMSTIGFNNILDRAYMQILSGAFDPNTAIRRAVKEIASKGVDKIAYPSGASTSVEAAVRRAVTTGVNQSVAKLQLARAEEMGCNLVETSSHAGARPTHGRSFALKGIISTMVISTKKPATALAMDYAAGTAITAFFPILKDCPRLPSAEIRQKNFSAKITMKCTVSSKSKDTMNGR